MTIIRTSGTAPDVVVNGVVNAEIKRLREQYEFINGSLLRENESLHRRLDDTERRVNKHPLKTVLIHWHEIAMCAIFVPWILLGELLRKEKCHEDE